LNVRLPFYRDPIEQMKILGERESKLLERLLRVKKLTENFEKFTTEEKHIMSVKVGFFALDIERKLNQNQHVSNVMDVSYSSLFSEFEKFISPKQKYVPIDQLQNVYRKLLQQTESNNMRNPKSNSSQHMREHGKHPSFLKEVRQLTKEDIDTFMNSLTNQSINENVIQTSRLQKVNHLLREITEYCHFSLNGISEIEEYCLEKIQKKKDIGCIITEDMVEEEMEGSPSVAGEVFVLQYLDSLKDTIEYEKQNPLENETLDKQEKLQQVTEFIKEAMIESNIRPLSCYPLIVGMKKEILDEKIRFLNVAKNFLPSPKENVRILSNYLPPRQHRSFDNETTDNRRQIVLTAATTQTANYKSISFN